MNTLGIIYVAGLVVWVAFLIAVWLRDHDDPDAPSFQTILPFSIVTGFFWPVLLLAVLFVLALGKRRNDT
jgi:hypothetical protein